MCRVISICFFTLETSGSISLTASSQRGHLPTLLEYGIFNQEQEQMTSFTFGFWKALRRYTRSSNFSFYLLKYAVIYCQSKQNLSAVRWSGLLRDYTGVNVGYMSTKGHRYCLSSADIMS